MQQQQQSHQQSEHEHTLRFGGKASQYHAAAISSSEADYYEEGLEGGGHRHSNSHSASPAGHHRRCNSADTYDCADCSVSSADSTLGSHPAYPPLSPQAQRAINASRRRFVASTLALVLGAVVLYVSGYRAGERHEEEKLTAALGVAGAGAVSHGESAPAATAIDDSIVADEGLLDADDDTVEELTAEEASDLDVDEIMKEAEEEAEEELALDEQQQQQQREYTYQKFLIFAEQRSGSRFLTSLLDDHPQIVCGNEELNHKDTPMNLKHMTIEDYMALLGETYDNVYQSKMASSTTTTSVVGYKIMYNQGPTHFGKELMASLDALGIKVIHLVRRNKLLQYISFASNEKDKHLMADEQKVAALAAAAAEAEQLREGGGKLKHQAHPKTKEEAQRIRDELVISGKYPEKILSFIEAREEDDRAVSNLVSTYLDATNYAFVDYEDLSGKTEVEMGRLFALLGVEERNVQSQMEKIHEGKLTRDYFREGQQDAVKEALENSEFRWMLDGW
eukprot:CAMPEP_0181034392 /NCGR_PEP_ID=MMETSP1070-20121207/7787_1 /TAXON_ID=265543 /ORGANISM="Minutocellus polymorphus, Strain NH13" /LENGTH=506 /DNA_ID=CAMNT_0023111925 /DNA_START=51 /DNA_END=1571 /DNA_ORIENTATION=-